MRFYIVDDDISIIKILQKIVEQDMTHEVVGTSTQPEDALSELLFRDVDIVLIDLLMPKLNGVAFVEALQKNKPHIKCIMISQVKDNDLREEAYAAGIEFFVSKPINKLEVECVIEHVKQNIEMATKLASIQSLLTVPNANQPTAPHVDYNSRIHAILNTLGISSETAAEDILMISLLMIEHDIPFSSIDFKTMLSLNTAQKRTLFQRIRRSIKRGLENLATIAQNDMENEIIMDHANILYGYKQLHQEMQFQTQKSSYGGKVSLKKFFDGLIAEVKR